MKKPLSFALAAIIICMQILSCTVSATGPEGYRKIVAVNHDDLSSSDYILTKETYASYGFTGNFNFILRPFTTAVEEKSMVSNVKKLIKNGNDIGLHAIMGSSYWIINKMYDIRPDGGRTFAPTQKEVTTPKVPSGKTNIFGQLANALPQNGIFYNPPKDLQDTPVMSMTDEQYSRLLDNYTLLTNPGTVTGLDLEGNTQTLTHLQWLEYWYNKLIDSSLGYTEPAASARELFEKNYSCGDGDVSAYYPDAEHLYSGKIVFFDDTANPNYSNAEYRRVGKFKQGLFKDCASACNYEVADRCIAVARAFFKHYFGIDDFKCYSRHGIRYSPCYWLDEFGIQYDDRERRVLAGEYGSFYNSRKGKFETFHDVFLDAGIQMTNYPTVVSPHFEGQIGLYYGQNGIRSPYFNAIHTYGRVSYLDLMGTQKTYAGDKISQETCDDFFAGVDNLLQYVYENSGKLVRNADGSKQMYIHPYIKRAIDSIRACQYTGKVPCFSWDTLQQDTGTQTAIRLIFDYCAKNGISVVSMNKARQLCVSTDRTGEYDYFPNPRFEQSLLACFTGGKSSSADAYLPDGWSAESSNLEQCSYTVEKGANALFRAEAPDNAPLTLTTQVFGLPAGTYELRFRAEAQGSPVDMEVYLRKNSDFIPKSGVSRPAASPVEVLSLSQKANEEYVLRFTIPEPTNNAKGNALAHAFCYGYEDNISGARLTFKLKKGTALTLSKPSLVNVSRSGESAAGTNGLKFTDVRPGDWFYSYVKELVSAGIVSGMTETSFAPNGTLTYGQALKLIAMAVGEKEPAKSGAHWASGWLTLAKNKGWLTEDVNLDANITRLALCKMAAKAKGLTAQPENNPFKDTSDKDVLALNKAGVINGMTATEFKPNEALTRAQISKIICALGDVVTN